MHHALQRNHQRITAWTLALPLLHTALKASNCSAILTDASGVVIAATPASRSQARLMATACVFIGERMHEILANKG